MTHRELTDLCLTLPAAYEDYPFDDTTPVIKHSGNHKMFALILEWDGRPAVNLKCDPFKAEILRSVYKDVIPGWHMNKTHWNTVISCGDIPHDELVQMITDSYDLVKPKVRKRK